MIRINKQRRNAKQAGQGMTEYIIIVGLIAIFLITAVKSFGGALEGTFGAATEKIDKEVTAAINGAGSGSAPGGGN